MAIHFVTGRPGAGKGLYTMRLVVEELRGSNRPIVTNFPIIKEKLAEYLHEEYGESFDVLTRIILIEKEEDLSNFYRIRKTEENGDLHFLDCELDSKGKQVRFDIDGAQDGGVFYVLDEVHIVFGARDWQEVGRAVLYYSSQHRKLGDDIILISQAPKNVDSQFRSIAQDYSVLRNHGMEKYMFFKQPSMFGRATYMNMPTGSKMDTPLETSYFKLNIKQADCYETARGVGLGPKDGAQADKGKDKRKGISIFWIFPAMGLIGYLVYLVPTFFAKTVTNQFTGEDGTKTVGERLMEKTKQTNKVDVAATNVVKVPAVAVMKNEEPKPQPRSEPKPVELPKVLSYTIRPKFNGGFDFSCVTDDGRRLSLSEKSIKSVSSTFIITEHDEKYYFDRPFDMPRVLRVIESGRRARPGQY